MYARNLDYNGKSRLSISCCYRYCFHLRKDASKRTVFVNDLDHICKANSLSIEKIILFNTIRANNNKKINQKIRKQICLELSFIAKFVVLRCAFCKLRRNFGFFSSVNHLLDLLGNTCLLVIGAFRSTMFVSVFQGSLLVIALYRTVSGNDRLVNFEAFYDLSYSCLLQKLSNVCLLPSTKIPLIIPISFAILEQFRVILRPGCASALHCDLH